MSDDKIHAPTPQVFVEEIGAGIPIEAESSVPLPSDSGPNQDFGLADVPSPNFSQPGIADPSVSSIIDRQSITPPHPIRNIRSDWLDIRPRKIGQGNNELVSTDTLPKDTSGMPDVNAFSVWPHRYRADLGQRDFKKASEFCHRPLHFEDPYLERIGMVSPGPGHCPAIHATAHMAWKTGLLPVSLTMDPVWQRHRSGFRTPYWKKDSQFSLVTVSTPRGKHRAHPPEHLAAERQPFHSDLGRSA